MVEDLCFARTAPLQFRADHGWRSPRRLTTTVLKAEIDVEPIGIVVAVERELAPRKVYAQKVEEFAYGEAGVTLRLGHQSVDTGTRCSSWTGVTY